MTQALIGIVVALVAVLGALIAALSRRRARVIQASPLPAESVAEAQKALDGVSAEREVEIAEATQEKLAELITKDRARAIARQPIPGE